MIAIILFIISMVFFAWASMLLHKLFKEQKAAQTKVCPKCLHVGPLALFKPEKASRRVKIKEQTSAFTMTSYVCPNCGNVESSFIVNS